MEPDRNPPQSCSNIIFTTLLSTYENVKLHSKTQMPRPLSFSPNPLSNPFISPLCLSSIHFFIFYTSTISVCIPVLRVLLFCLILTEVVLSWGQFCFPRDTWHCQERLNRHDFRRYCPLTGSGQGNCKIPYTYNIQERLPQQRPI